VGFVIALITITVLVPFAATLIPVIRKPSNVLSLSYWKDVKRSAALIFGREDGVYGSSMSHIFDYLRRDFHPNDHDTSEWLAYYKQRLLDPKTGLLAPYFVREFTPGLQA
jgi:predicted metal-dependent hydrolase